MKELAEKEKKGVNYMEVGGLIQFDWTIVFQLANTLILILVIYSIVKFFRKIRKSREETARRLESIESKISNIEENQNKLNN